MDDHETHAAGTALATVARTATRLPVMLVGNWQTSDFAAASANLRLSTSSDFADTLGGACELLHDSEEPPELIFVAQHLPADYAQADVDRMQALAPLARIVFVAGTWCEGELRTGTPPVGVIRLYWYELASWWQAAQQRHRAGRCPLWSQPLNPPLAARWSATGNEIPAPAHSLVLIDAHDFSVYGALAASLAGYDIASTWARHLDQASDAAATERPFTAGIWDGGQLSKAEQARLAEFCHRINGPVVTLLDFPRREHIEMAKALGATAVFGKPYIVEELVAALLDS